MVVNVRNETRKKDRTSSNRRTLEDSTKIKQCKKVEDKKQFPGGKRVFKGPLSYHSSLVLESQYRLVFGY
jgi:hypothetical protein